MKRMIVAAGLTLIPGIMFGQEEQILSPREVADAARAELRGLQEMAVQHALPTSPFIFGTTTPLPKPKAEPKPAGGTVSVASLSHRVPKAAKQAFDRASNFFDKGDVGKAVQELEKAVALDPQYAEAHSDLGVGYMQLQRILEAESEFRRAIALDPYISVAHSNLGWALLWQRNFPDAEQSARRALALALNNDSAHVLLGLLLGAEPATRAEAVRHIEQATGTFPQLGPLLEELRRN